MEKQKVRKVMSDSDMLKELNELIVTVFVTKEKIYELMEEFYGDFEVFSDDIEEYGIDEGFKKTVDGLLEFHKSFMFGHFISECNRILDR